ncbi:MAG: hypothetical protein NXI27_13015 [Alphaproteobacteria bacterium]|nr:hypothetical protein [Alphaproteobacteria bacterium]
MENIRKFIVAIVGLGIAALMIFVMATVGLAVIGLAVVVGIAGLLVAKFGPRRKVHKESGPRVWDDGHGKIIDM